MPRRTALTLSASGRGNHLKITDVKASLHRVPVAAPLLKEKLQTPIVFTTVETDEGILGYGLTRPPQRFGAREFINREAAPFLRGTAAG